MLTWTFRGAGGGSCEHWVNTVEVIVLFPSGVQYKRATIATIQCIYTVVPISPAFCVLHSIEYVCLCSMFWIESQTQTHTSTQSV